MNQVSMKLQTGGGPMDYRNVMTLTRANGTQIVVAQPVLDLGHGVFAAPGMTVSPSGQPLVTLVLTEWGFYDFGTVRPRPLPIAYVGEDPWRMAGFALRYAAEGRALDSVDLERFCDAWRAETGLGMSVTSTNGPGQVKYPNGA